MGHQSLHTPHADHTPAPMHGLPCHTHTVSNLVGQVSSRDGLVEVLHLAFKANNVESGVLKCFEKKKQPENI